MALTLGSHHTPNWQRVGAEVASVARVTVYVISIESDRARNGHLVG